MRHPKTLRRKKVPVVASSSMPMNGALPPRTHLARHSSVEQLKQRRRQRQLQGRSHIRPVRHQDLSQFGAALPEVLADDPKLRTEIKRVDEQAALSGVDEQEASLIGATMIAAATSASTRVVTTSTAKASASSEHPRVRPPISIYLFKEMVVEVQNSSGVKKAVVLQRKRREDDRYIERDLLAYLAALRGQHVNRNKLLEGVFGYGLPDSAMPGEEESKLRKLRQPEALRNQLNKTTQFLRGDINAIAAQLGLTDKLKIIGSDHDEWYLLTDECRVVDLDEVDRHYVVLEGIKGQHYLDENVQQACEGIIKVYRGNFLENYVEDAVQAGHDEWDSNWMRPFYTAYLKKYLVAVWYRAEYWHLKADAIVASDEASRVLQQTYYETAAKLYEDYVYHAVPGFNDQAAMAFASDIETIAAQAERALRSALDMYTATGNTQAGEPVYQTFCNRMVDLWSFLSDEDERGWRPKNDTIDAWKNLRAQTKAHRKTGSVTPHEIAPAEVRHAEKRVRSAQVAEEIEA